MNRNRGFTVVELMIVITVVAVGITLAVPSFHDLVERKAVGGAAEAAYEQLQIARSQAVKRSKAMIVDFNIDGTNWAIGVTDKMAGCNAEDTSGTGLCTIDYNNDLGIADADNVVKRIEGADYKDITMSQTTVFVNPTAFSGDCVGATLNDQRACFDFVRGYARTGVFDFASANYKLRVQVTRMGHVNICIPPNEKKIVGYDDC